MKTVCPLPRAVIKSQRGAWFQRLRSNETLALSQYGQATFTSLQTLSAGNGRHSSIRSHAHSAGLACVVRSVVRGRHHSIESKAHAVSWDSATNSATDGMRSTAGLPLIPSRTESFRAQPTVGNSAFTVNNAKFLPQPRAGLAWSPFGNKHTTVIRAGFGMYNDLQDALGYRTDQNAPFNPTYSLPSVPVSQLPAFSHCSDSGHCKAGSRRSSAGSENSDAGFLVVPNPTRTHGQYRS